VLISAAPVKRFSPANRLRKKVVIALLFAELNRIEKTFLQASHLLKVFSGGGLWILVVLNPFRKVRSVLARAKGLNQQKPGRKEKTGGGERKSFGRLSGKQ